ncbi:hypothetical protein DMENIID0001_040340 [Sergentomyia squamirostris]
MFHGSCISHQRRGIDGGDKKLIDDDWRSLEEVHTIIESGSLVSERGDVLSGVCFVGQLDTHSLGIFLLLPLCIYLGIGALFLLAGFVSLFRIRTVMKHDGNRTDKLERLMMRIGFFSGLFILPSLGFLACLFYEYYSFDEWMIHWNRSMCTKFSTPCPLPRPHRDEQKPIFQIYMVKYVCSMLVGVTSSVWLWSGKTVVSWRLFIERLQGRDTARSRATAYV